MPIKKQVNGGINKKYHSELYNTVKTQQSLRALGGIVPQHINVSAPPQIARGQHQHSATGINHTHILEDKVLKINKYSLCLKYKNAVLTRV